MVPDVGLALYLAQWRLSASFVGSAAQVAIQLMREKLMHLRLAVLLLRHPQGRVLRQPLRHHVRPDNKAADQLGGPPLVCELMCRYEIGEVNILIRIEHPPDPERLGEGTGVGERLRKLAVAWEFHDTELLDL